ncbi:hypothetical protein ASPCADRAFT_11281 [Aspergillus carbonarius ITEM 5010]|uniref:Uncharacterized protein n=1 Tax=Aspergillus carbonarius (strain ITEM 5010) TaxID=602072 RepID=A0A1R3R5Q2_ASPC5|nr:hypothetical protein ASPCADRAFT_11281 [Aspergillus carbonarius ITEM 5010]
MRARPHTLERDLGDLEHFADDHVNLMLVCKPEHFFEVIRLAIDESLQGEAATDGENVDILLLTSRLAFAGRVPNGVVIPDLPFRIRKDLELNVYNGSTFYTPKTTIGNTDYPLSAEYLAQHTALQ